MAAYRFDQAAADKAVAFFPRYLRHTEGEWAGRPFVLAPWQEEIVRALFGWKRADGTRRYRVVYIEIPRKNGKTEFAAGLAILCLVGDGEFGGQGYSMACDEEQAKIAFNKASVMVQFSEDLQRDLEVLKTAIFCPTLMASFKPLTKKASTKHGFSPTFAIADEIHQWPDGEVADVIHKGTAARRQAIEIYITTAGIRGQGFGWEMHERALKVRDGVLADDKMLVCIFAADPEDDWTAEATWRKANPGFGVSPKAEFIAAECAEAGESPRKENDFKRFHLNLWTEQAVRWLPMAKWDAGAVLDWRTMAEGLTGRTAFAGLDLSTTTDLTALTLVFPPAEDEEVWRLLFRAWIPEERMAERVKRDRVPYDQWQRDGAVTVTPGNVVDYTEVREGVMADAERFDLRGLAIDRWNSMQISVELMEAGLPVELFGQGFVSMNGPSKEFERLVTAGLVDHGGHPLARWAASNVAVLTDPAGNIKPAKDKSTGRIDPIVAAIMGLGLAVKGEGHVNIDRMVAAIGGI